MRVKKIWVENLRTGTVGYLIREIEDDLIAVMVPTPRYGDQFRYWSCFRYLKRQRAPRSDRGKPRLKLIAGGRA